MSTTAVADILVDRGGFEREAVEAALADPAALGLPAYAEGEPEGFLFPATYDVEPGDAPAQVLAAMVDRFEVAADAVGLVAGAERLGYSRARARDDRLAASRPRRRRTATAERSAASSTTGSTTTTGCASTPP